MLICCFAACNDSSAASLNMNGCDGQQFKKPRLGTCVKDCAIRDIVQEEPIPKFPFIISLY